MIGSESGARFLNKSQNLIKQKQCKIEFFRRLIESYIVTRVKFEPESSSSHESSSSQLKLKFYFLFLFCSIGMIISNVFFFLVYGFYFSKIFEASYSCRGIVVFYVEYIKHDIRCVVYMMKKSKINIIPCFRS